MEIASQRKMELRGVEVHNLRGIDLDIPHHQLAAICGVSGSGKTSLALDTLYAEGQRRYIESFSAYARQFLQKLDKPTAKRIDGVPAAVAVTRQTATSSERSTVAGAAGIAEHLRLLFARMGRLICPSCGCQAQQDSPDTAAQWLAQITQGQRFMIVFRLPLENDLSADDISAGNEGAVEPGKVFASLQSQGFVRVVVDEKIVDISDASLPKSLSGKQNPSLLVVVDRLVSGKASLQRLRDSLETAFHNGKGSCAALLPDSGDSTGVLGRLVIDGRQWRMVNFQEELHCRQCGAQYEPAEPRWFNFNHPLGACPQCEGSGQIADFDRDLLLADWRKAIGSGAIAPLEEPKYASQRKKWLQAAQRIGLPLDQPFAELDKTQREIVFTGDVENDFEGVLGFLNRLQTGKQTAGLRAFLNRWRSPQRCPTCHGARLKSESLAWRLGEKSIAEICELTPPSALEFMQSFAFSPIEHRIAEIPRQQIEARLQCLIQVGVGHLALERRLSTLSGGELQRVALSTTLSSNLVNMLYVLDEPTAGLHAADADRLMEAIGQLRQRGNTVVMVEHNEAALRSADHIIEIGPGAGADGGNIVFQGSIEQLQEPDASLTGEYLTGRKGEPSSKRRLTNRGRIHLIGARGNNLKQIDVEFPLGVLCVVTGVSGAGKSTLVQDTLYGALCRRLNKNGPKPLPYDDLDGNDQIDDVVLIDQAPLTGSSRSNPVTYIKAFDEIRAVFAESLDARTRNYQASHFSFNVEGGRCNVCRGEGEIAINMKFLPDVRLTCSQCGGARFRKEILEVMYRGRNIAQVLQMTVREAFSFFRGRPKVQSKLKRLIDVGLAYLQLGQSAATLSAGESQRLRLAARLAQTSRRRTLCLFDEPSAGLHYADIECLLDCFDALASVGHSLIIVEHHLQIIRAADYVIELGPGAGAAGGEVVAAGPPEDIAQDQDSPTGRYLRREF